MRVRRQAEVRAAGDEKWFAPALDTLASLPTEVDGTARAFFELEKSLYIGRAPGRLDVMGGIADYSGATVLELPLACATFAVVQRQPASRFDVATRRAGRWHFFDIDMSLLERNGALSDATELAAWFAARPDDHWAAYVIGAVQYCLRDATRANRTVSSGLRIMIDSSVPEGKGVSSSAAIEVAVMAAVSAACGVDVSAEEVAASCQWVENHIVGAPCGIMDQMTSACGRADRLLRLRCQPGEIEDYIEIAHDYRFYGIDSGVRHAVTGADYGTVRTAAFMGYRIIAERAGLATSTRDGRVSINDPFWGGYLANIPAPDFAARFERQLPERMSGAEFLAAFGGTTDTATRVVPDRNYPVRAATAHPVYEQDRVVAFAALLADVQDHPDAAHQLGRLMFAAHASYSSCGLGSDGTDRLVELVAAAGPRRGLFGAKITGGGSGGTVAVLGTHDALSAIAEIAAAYSSETGRASEVFDASGPGADAVGVLFLER